MFRVLNGYFRTSVESVSVSLSLFPNNTNMHAFELNSCLSAAFTMTVSQYVSLLHSKTPTYSCNLLRYTAWTHSVTRRPSLYCIWVICNIYTTCTVVHTLSLCTNQNPFITAPWVPVFSWSDTQLKGLFWVSNTRSQLEFNPFQWIPRVRTSKTSIEFIQTTPAA